MNTAKYLIIATFILSTFSTYSQESDNKELNNKNEKDIKNLFYCPNGLGSIGLSPNQNFGINVWDPQDKLEIRGSNVFLRLTEMEEVESGFIISDYTNETNQFVKLLYNSLTNNFAIYLNSNTYPIIAFTKDGKTITKDIYAQKVKVQNNVMGDYWPDFVFKKDYQLMDLSELETYINKNQSLPLVPSAKDVSTEGIDLAEMNAILLQKIEELTLYIIEQQKEINEIKKQIQ
jgi:hypothetical protein